MHCVGQLPTLWQDPAPAARPSSASLDLPLLPSRLGRAGAAALTGAQLVFALELLMRAQLLPAALAVGMAALFWLGCKAASRSRAQRPRRLLLLADGRVRVLTVSGELQAAELLPASLRLGAWVLLLVRAPSGLHRLLLGPDNLPPAQLAALRRRVSVAAARPETVLYPHRRQSKAFGMNR